jgi:hypothetical protein
MKPGASIARAGTLGSKAPRKGGLEPVRHSKRQIRHEFGNIASSHADQPLAATQRATAESCGYILPRAKERSTLSIVKVLLALPLSVLIVLFAFGSPERNARASSIPMIASSTPPDFNLDQNACAPAILQQALPEARGSRNNRLESGILRAMLVRVTGLLVVRSSQARASGYIPSASSLERLFHLQI